MELEILKTVSKNISNSVVSVEKYFNSDENEFFLSFYSYRFNKILSREGKIDYKANEVNKNLSTRTKKTTDFFELFIVLFIKKDSEKWQKITFTHSYTFITTEVTNITYENIDGITKEMGSEPSSSFVLTEDDIFNSDTIDSRYKNLILTELKSHLKELHSDIINKTEFNKLFLSEYKNNWPQYFLNSISETFMFVGNMKLANKDSEVENEIKNNDKRKNTGVNNTLNITKNILESIILPKAKKLNMADNTLTDATTTNIELNGAFRISYE